MCVCCILLHRFETIVTDSLAGQSDIRIFCSSMTGFVVKKKRKREKERKSWVERKRERERERERGRERER